MRRLFTLLLVLSRLAVYPQFFPDSNTIWCIENGLWFPGFDVQLIMGESPDTLIVDNIYKRVDEFNNSSGSWAFVKRHYVRSEGAHEGYIYLLDSLQEYLVGKTDVEIGDTVHGVFMVHSLYDIVIEGIEELSNAGIGVTRYFISCDALGTDVPSEFLFWQPGMGTSFGPFIRHGLLEDPLCVIANDTVLYNLFNSGMPGGSLCCTPIAMNIESTASSTMGMHVFPNPSLGSFTVVVPDHRGVWHIEIIDMAGRSILSRSFLSPQFYIDLSGQEPGLYHVAVQREGYRAVGKIIVER